MGAGIAQVGCQAGMPTILYDPVPEALERGEASVRKRLEKFSGEPAELRVTDDLRALAECDLVIEAVPERPDLKRELFAELSGQNPDVVLATNTSSIPITRIAASVSRPERVIGMHFMNPVPVMQLVEIIRGAQTSDATYTATRSLAERMGKTTVLSKDMPGFIVNRILIPMLNEACFALQEGLATAEDIDTAMKLGTNVPMGPLTLADFIGLDTCLYIAEVLHKGLGDDKYRPAPLLRQYVDAGWLGRKTKRGFHRY